MNISSIKEIGNGANSKVYLLTSKNGKKYLGKFYFSDSFEKKDRMKTEFSSLTFLWNKKVRCIPKPIGRDQKNHFAIYEYIEGAKIKSEKVTEEDINKACRFLIRLNQIKKEKEARKFPPAAEACFSVKEIVENIKARLDKLTSLPKKEKINLPLFEFLSKEFTPSLEKIVAWCKKDLIKQGITYTVEIDQKCRTLSPSDFGFHNALRRGKEIVFLDFEYFGWDDPSKMIADFLFHPKMPIREDLKKMFVQNMLSAFREDKRLKGRLKTVFPLFGLKWCLIFLNEFLPEDFQRREFARGRKLDKRQVCKRQLLKARKLLAQIKTNYGNFPYG